MKKSELRKLHLEKRAALTREGVAAMSEQIAQQFFENTDLADVRTLHTFIPIHRFNEVDTSLIYSRLWLDFPEIATAAPRTDLSNGRIESVQFDASTAWTENHWGIREPTDGELIDPKLIDLVIVPLLCFDEYGQRVGYGKGMYDRFLARCRSDCLKVGVSFFPPVGSIEDINEADIRLNACITLDRVYRPPKEKDAVK
ncbi:MAG TPA: 5-formyltetrahydrofolate cyclo-ligase [Pyrinomonadaceae bacterium]|nr:5-formyltetrahydrofolate cyclo-ligase [Acidobacteriota bacterium]HQZ94771.1 5-formyltetrahydrofolate cyclo-ligase [Pyrinomonadaceae bacterium]